MRCFIVYNQTNGDILETADIGYGFEIEKEVVQLSHPNKGVIEITYEDYEKIKEGLQFYVYKDNQIKLKEE